MWSRIYNKKKYLISSLNCICCLKLYLAFDVVCLPGIRKPQQKQEWNHWSHRQESQVHRPFFWSSLSSEYLGSSHLKKEDCDTNVLNRFNIINKYFSIIPILTLNRSRRTAWVENPVHISNEMVESSDTSATTSVVTPIERKTPIREFLFIQKKILSTKVCMSPMSLM